mmetsp:Transcript_44847/g.118506  ORF Transcript_44847/g.118506 Transcript_44847/m.118506 type:complete len:95 (-) Transcript_44847:319-603(-)
MMQHRMPVSYENLVLSMWICAANSRVGAKTKPHGIGFGRRDPDGFDGGPLRSNDSRQGTMKAQVLPLPVWAQAIRSRPDTTMGIECFWTGVGLS